MLMDTPFLCPTPLVLGSWGPTWAWVSGMLGSCPLTQSTPCLLVGGALSGSHGLLFFVAPGMQLGVWPVQPCATWGSRLLTEAATCEPRLFHSLCDLGQMTPMQTSVSSK